MGRRRPFDWNKLWEQVDQMMGGDYQSVPLEGGFTAVEFAERYNLPIETARYRIRKLIREGKVRIRGKSKQGRNWVIVYELV